MSQAAYRFGAIESNSSKNKIQGLAALARSNRSLTDFSLAPMYLLRISGPLTEMKFRPHSLATAEASSVLPHPGYPYSRRPDRRRSGQEAKIWAYLVGHSNVSLKIRRGS
jgi:hypothetical protein